MARHSWTLAIIKVNIIFIMGLKCDDWRGGVWGLDLGWTEWTGWTIWTDTDLWTGRALDGAALLMDGVFAWRGFGCWPGVWPGALAFRLLALCLSLARCFNAAGQAHGFALRRAPKKTGPRKRRPVTPNFSVKSVSVHIVHFVHPVHSTHLFPPLPHFAAFFSQSFRNASIPLSVRGCSMSWVRVL